MSRIAGLNDLKDKKNEEKKDRNEYFAGGFDNRTGGGSGLAVEGPPDPRRGGPSSDPFEGIVRQAQNAAERPVSAEGSSGSAITIALYRNGFVVNDGPLRDLTSPENRAFLAALERGDLPAELRDPSSPGEVDVQLMDKRQEDYQAPPPPAYIPYSGSGSRVGATSNSDAFIFSVDVLDLGELAIDESKPTTTVQVKTYDGKKLKLKLNHTSTVLQLAAYIQRSNGSPVGLFTLSAGFPPKDIIDPTQTIAEANLLGASITQKQL